MRRGIFFFLLLFLSVWLGLLIRQHAYDSGMLLIALKNWTIQMPVWLAAVGILLGYGICYVVLSLLKKIMDMKYWLQHCNTHMRQHYARVNTRRGLIEFSEGNWKKAEYHLIKALPGGDIALLNYLAAARAAQELGASDRRDEYLREAQKTIPDAKIAIELTQAQLQIANEQWEQALATLNHLHTLSPYHPYVMKLLTKVYRALKDWSHLETWLLPIRRKKIFNQQDFAQLENEVYAGLLEKTSVDTLMTVWAAFPSAIHHNSVILTAYITKLIAYQAHDEAEHLCRQALKREWHDNLIVLYGQCETTRIEDQLRFAESFLKNDPNNAYLLLALGTMCVRRQLWGKAKSYFTKSAQMHPNAAVYAQLAALSEQLNDQDAANAYYKKSVALFDAA